MDTEIGQHVVAVTVFVNAQGVDDLDAANVAEYALRQVFETSPTMTIQTHAGYDRTATVLDVAEVGTALRNGKLAVRPTRQTPTS